MAVIPSSATLQSVVVGPSIFIAAAAALWFMAKSLRLNDNALGFPSICSCTKASVAATAGCTAPKLILILSAWWRPSVLPIRNVALRYTNHPENSTIYSDGRFNSGTEWWNHNRHLIQFNTIHCQCGYQPPVAFLWGIKVVAEEDHEKEKGRLLALSIKNSVSKWNEFGAIRNSNNPSHSYRGWWPQFVRNAILQFGANNNWLARESVLSVYRTSIGWSRERGSTTKPPVPLG